MILVGLGVACGSHAEVLNREPETRPRPADKPRAAGPLLVTLIHPAQGSWFVEDMYIRVQAAASDTNCEIKEVRFFAETNLIGVVTNAPYEV